MISNVKAWPVTYEAGGTVYTGTNVTYLIDGQPASARLNWVAGTVEAERWLNATKGRTGPR